MIIGTLFTLFIVPSIYLLISKRKVLKEDAHHPLLGGMPESVVVAS